MCFLWKKLKGYYKNLKIQQKLTFSHLIIVLIPMLVIGVFFYTSLYDMIVSNTIRSEQERAAETAPRSSFTSRQRFLQRTDFRKIS